MPIMPRRRADHPGPRLGNGRGGACGFRHAHHRRWEGRAVPPCRSTAGKVVPVMPRRRAHHPGPRPGKLVPRRSPVVPSCRSTPVRSCRAAVPIIDLAAVVPVVPIDSREAGARRAVPPCPSSRATAWQRPRWCPWFPSCPSSTAGRSCRAAVPIDSREGRARHAAPPCPSSRATAWQRPRWCPWFPSCPSSTAGRSCRAAVSIDGGKLVPVVPRCRSTGGSWCPSSRATARNGRGGARRADDRQPGSWCPSCRGADRRREGRAHHRRREGCTVPPCRSTPAGVREGHADRRRKAGARHAAPRCRSSTLPRWCPSCRSTAGKLVPIIQGHGLASWCRAGPPSCRRADRRREGRAAVPIIDLAAVVPVVSIDSREAGADHPGPRPGNGRGGARGFRHADHRRRKGGARRAAVPIDGGKVVPVMPRRRADHPGPRPGKLVPRRSPVVPSCRSSTAGKVVPVVPPCRSTAGRSCPSSTAGRLYRAAVPIDAGRCPGRSC